MTDGNPTQRIYHFYDGDFIFWAALYEGNPPDVFRVRVGQDPKTRLLENQRNPNRAPPGDPRVEPASQASIDRWLEGFARDFPQRLESHTAILRHLKLHGPQRAPALGPELLRAAHSLCQPIHVVRDFRSTYLTFVQCTDDGEWGLTSDGHWLTSLMK